MFNADPTAQKLPSTRSTESVRDTSLATSVPRKCRTAVLFDNLGPYHRARLAAVVEECELLAIEFGRSSSDYQWCGVHEEKTFRRVTINPLGESRALCSRVFRERLEKALEEFDAEVVFLPGWSCRGSMLAMRWCLRNRKRVVVMTESTAEDASRTLLREFLKRRFLRLVGAALAGGTRQRDYLLRLGMKRERIGLGYDAVDNAYFARGAAHVRNWQRDAKPSQKKHLLPAEYFLASARFVEKKNLPRLIEAYSNYRRLLKSATETTERRAWDLVLLGDGPLGSLLRSQVQELCLEDCIHFFGFQDYKELPLFYGRAQAFVQASIVEPWGLVVNEAMASGLPVIVSSRCGCATDLVQDGYNGFLFDPCNVQQLANLLLRVSEMETEERSRMGRASQRVIAAWGPARFAQGLRETIAATRETSPTHTGFLDRLLLRLLVLRSQSRPRSQT